MVTVDPGVGAGNSAVSWASIGAGALVAAGVSLILLALGSGLGFASLSPWAGRGASAGTLTVVAAIWLIVTQWIAAALGGFIAGRLRVRWAGTHHHEVFFRDTAHGLVTWALATVIVTVWAGTALSAMLGSGVRTAAEAAGPATGAAMSASPGDEGYDIDRMLRPLDVTATATRGNEGERNAADRAEVARILAKLMVDGSLPDSDRQYLAGLVAARTGLPAPAAQKRVDDLVANATEARSTLQAKADAARKAAAQSSIFLSLALLIGAFIASVSAALGGRLRDQHA